MRSRSNLKSIVSVVRSKGERLGRDQRGTVLVTFAGAGMAAMAFVGAAIDYSRVTMVTIEAQSAADAAVLAAGAQATASHSTRQDVATRMATAYFGAKATTYNLQATEYDLSPGVYKVTLTGTFPLIMGQFINKPSTTFTISAAATSNGVTAAKPLEMALALDNTGSMSNNMADLKTASNTLVDTVMGAGGGAARVSVVPYVAAVNPGLTDATSIANYIDTTAVNPWNGVWMRGAWITWGLSSCSAPAWGSGGSSGGAGTGGSGDARDILDILKPIRHLANELFGVSSAFAADVTPNTKAPFTTSSWKSPQSKKTYTVPAGFQTVGKDVWGSGSTGGCDWLANPNTVSQYELFPRILDQNGNKVAWKGCVEARLSKSEQSWLNSNWGYSYNATTDYDVSEVGPTKNDSASLFVPYFWPDEPDYSPYTWGAVSPGAYSGATQGFHNNYLADGSITSSWGWHKLDSNLWWGAGQFILKYDSATKAAIIRETPDSSGYTYGPNAGCPDPLLRLTNNVASVKAKISGLTYWQSGGTIISEGLTWAWRTLSPNAPYMDGAAYNTPGVQKVIVLMTDGVNELIDNGNNATAINDANISDYSAYGYLGGQRLWNANSVHTYSAFNTLMDSKLLAACTAAKNAGVKIYTVTFNHAGFLTTAQQTAAQNLLKSCASQATYSYLATDGTSLNSAFAAIAVSATAGTLRLIPVPNS